MNVLRLDKDEELKSVVQDRNLPGIMRTHRLENGETDFNLPDEEIFEVIETYNKNILSSGRTDLVLFNILADVNVLKETVKNEKGEPTGVIFKIYQKS